MYRHVESRRKQSRRPESGMPGHYATTTTTTERSRASSIPTSDGATYGLGLSNLSRADDIQYNQHVIPQTSYAGEEASWPLVAPDSTLLPSSAAEEHYDTLSTPFHHQLLGHNDVPTTVSLFQQSTPSPIPGPLLQPYPQYRPETGQHFASALHLASSHATENLDLEISPSVKPEEDYNDWLPDQSDSGSSLSAQPSEIYDTPPQLQPSPHRSWQAHSNFNQVQNFAQLEQPSGKLPIRSSKRASIGHHPPCQCSFCGQLFGKRSNLKTHEQYKHSPNYVKRFECPTTGCGRKFDRKMDLKRHIKSVHDKIRDVECEFCGLSFPRVDTKQRHAKHCPSRFFGPRERTTTPVPPTQDYSHDRRNSSSPRSYRETSGYGRTGAIKPPYYQEA